MHRIRFTLSTALAALLLAAAPAAAVEIDFGNVAVIEIDPHPNPDAPAGSVAITVHKTSTSSRTISSLHFDNLTRFSVTGEEVWDYVGTRPDGWSIYGSRLAEHFWWQAQPGEEIAAFGASEDFALFTANSIIAQWEAGTLRVGLDWNGDQEKISWQTVNSVPLPAAAPLLLGGLAGLGALAGRRRRG